MPSVSEAQHRFVAMKAAQGQKWAREWLHADKGRVKGLPQHKHRREAIKRLLHNLSR